MSISPKKYPTIYEAKQEIVEIGRRMYDKDYVAANDGNISCKIDEHTILATPTGVSKGFMKENMMVRISLDGKVLSYNDGYAPSSEIKMHLRVYKENPEVAAVVHAHPMMATSYAIAGIDLVNPILTEQLLTLGNVYVARYATPGTEEVPDSIAPYCLDYNAVLLANHGTLTWGDSLMQAYYRLESLEHYATILMYTSNILGKCNVLTCEQIKPLIQTRENMGIKGGGSPPCNACNNCNLNKYRET